MADITGRDDTDVACPPLRVELDDRGPHLALGHHHCAITSTGETRCWHGSRELREPAQHPLAEVVRTRRGTFSLASWDGATTARTVLDVGLADCVVRDDGTLGCWRQDRVESWREIYGDAACGLVATPVSAAVPCLVHDGRLMCGPSLDARKLATRLDALLEPGDEVLDLFWHLGPACVTIHGGRVACDDGESWRWLEGTRGIVSLHPMAQQVCALTDTHDVKCARRDELEARLQGADPVVVEDLWVALPRAPGLDAPVTAISAGGSHACALFDDGQAGCWGRSGAGSLGTGASVDIDIFAGDLVSPVVGLPPVVALASRHGLTCALTAGDDVMCWGDIEDQLIASAVPASEAYAPLGDARVASISMHGGTACAVHDGGRVACWGDNDAGQLGVGLQARRWPYPLALDLPTASTVEVGTDRAYAVTEDGELVCWGRASWCGVSGGSDDEIGPRVVEGLTDVREVVATSRRTVVFDAAGEVYVWGRSEVPRRAAIPGRVVRLLSTHSWRPTCAVTATDELVCLDDDGWTISQSAPVAALGAGVLVTSNGELSKAVVRSAEIELRGDPLVEGVIDLACGARCCAVTGDGNLLCDRGQQDWESIELPTPARVLAVDRFTACTLDDASALRCFGDTLLGSVMEKSPTPVSLTTPWRHTSP